MKRFSIFRWDPFSDQPYQIKNQKEKKILKKENRWNIIKTIILSTTLLPVFIFRTFFPIRKSEINISQFFGIGINLDKGEEQIQFLNELKLKSINIRFPLSDIVSIEKYIEFTNKFQDYNILLTVLQDRQNIEDLEVFRKNIEIIFQKFSEIGVKEFQIGNAINRTKWGFFSITEYLKFYKVAFDVRESLFQNIKLIGSAVIDFEYYNTVHTLFHFQDIHYDGVSSLLYVDRRGAPENKQSLIFSLEKKIELLWGMVRTSSKTDNRIYITETNYPIKNTSPYTPTSSFEAISLKDYKIYMVRYFFIALSTQMVERVYWHQLISAGYGLVDNRNGEFKKYSAFKTLKLMLEILENRRYISHSFSNNLHIVEFAGLKVYWTISDEVKIKSTENKKVIDIDGNIENKKEIEISNSPIYCI